VSALRKQREKSGFAGELDFDTAMEEQGQRQQQWQQRQQQGKGRPGERISGGFKTPSKKRQVKNEKFGFGGRKRLKKQNDAFSSASMEGYKPGRFDDGLGRKKGSGGVQKKKGGKGGGGQRPGKARRQQMKAKKGRG
jgi:rRNA-processing protein EBP2